MASPKPLIMPWLVTQIDSGRYPGLCWTNEERTEFRIPWKHGLRQDLCPEDKDEREERERESEREERERERERKKERVFVTLEALLKMFYIFINGQVTLDEILRELNLQEGVSADPCHADSAPRGAEGVLQFQCSPVQYENLSPAAHSDGDSAPFGAEAAGQVHDPMQYGNLSLPAAQSDSAPRGAEGVLQFQCSPVQYENLSPAAHSDGDSAPFGAEAAGQVHDPMQYGNLSLPAAQSDSAPRGVEEPLQKFKAQLSGIQTRLTTQFRVVVYYRGLKVHEELVTNENGFRVHATGAEPVMSHLQGVCLPDPSPLFDKRQADLTRVILGKLGGGLAVEVRDSSILGARLGDTRAYWSCSQFDQSRTPREVPKIETEIYNTNQFIKDLISFIENRSGSPQFCLWFCVGEKWPDPENRPWEKKLIMIEVTPISLEILKTLAVCGGASSLQSEDVELQISTEMSSMLSLLYESMDTN
ncbi:interferon regulatory factor 3-like [Polyodon spathula]|uniref:interferon regulatory factor 3-like n=1 Tax=Polyodon spathula TaxID=7913 RepID=UPI001B7E6AE2|nr:interferon regulatory factor 3-like [Polyodon spathula]